jgi:hypothetical protein
MRVRSSGVSLVLGLVGAAAVGGCTCSGGEGRSAAVLPPRCSLDAGPCDPVPVAAAMLDLGSFRGLATGPGGATYVTGALLPPTRTFDGHSLTSAGGLDVFVGRYDAANARATWVRRLGDLGVQEPAGLAVTSKGTLAVVGHFTGTLEADQVSARSPSGAGADFVLGLRGSDGRLLWAHAFDDGPGGALAAVAASSDADRIAVCGHASQAANALAPGATFHGGAQDAIVAMFDGSGQRLWATQLGGPGNESCTAVAVDPAGDVYAAGRYNQSFALSMDLPDPGGTYNYWIWVARLDGSSGKVLAAAAFGGPSGAQLPTTVAVDRRGQLILGGTMNNALDFRGDAGTLISAGYGDAFVAKLDPRSSPPFSARWAVRLGGPGSDATRSVAVDPHGDVAVTGFFTFRTTGAAELEAELPTTDAFLLLLDGENGTTRSAMGFGDRETQTGERVAFGTGVDGRPYLALGGEFTGSIGFRPLESLSTPGAATYLFISR